MSRSIEVTTVLHEGMRDTAAQIAPQEASCSCLARVVESIPHDCICFGCNVDEV